MSIQQVPIGMVMDPFSHSKRNSIEPDNIQSQIEHSGIADRLVEIYLNAQYEWNYRKIWSNELSILRISSIDVSLAAKVITQLPESEDDMDVGSYITEMIEYSYKNAGETDFSIVSDRTSFFYSWLATDPKRPISITHQGCLSKSSLRHMQNAKCVVFGDCGAALSAYSFNSMFEIYGNVGYGTFTGAKSSSIAIYGDAGDYLGLDTVSCNITVLGNCGEDALNGSKNSILNLFGEFKDTFCDGWKCKNSTIYVHDKPTYKAMGYITLYGANIGLLSDDGELLEYSKASRERR